MRNALLRSAICARRFLHRCVLSSAFVSGCPGLPWPRPGPPCLCTQSSACRLYSKRRQSSNAATTSSAHFHDQCLALPIRFQSQPDCPTAPMPLLYPRLRCALTELHCASSLRRGDPLPTCTFPSQQGAGHCPHLDLKGQRQHHLLVPRLYWQQRGAALPRALAPALAHLHRSTTALATTTPWP